MEFNECIKVALIFIGPISALAKNTFTILRTLGLCFIHNIYDDPDIMRKNASSTDSIAFRF